MSQNKGKKRNKAYYVASAKKRRWASCLDAGMKGFLVTCNNQEKQCVRESYNLLNEYADKLYGPQVVRCIEFCHIRPKNWFVSCKKSFLNYFFWSKMFVLCMFYVDWELGGQKNLRVGIFFE